MLLAFTLCIISLPAFSHIAKADEIKGHSVRQDVYLIDKDGDILWENFLNFKPNDKEEEKLEDTYDECTANQLRGMQIKHRTVWNIFAPTEGYPFELNKVNKITLENFYYRYLLDDAGLHYVSQYDDIYIMFTYADNTTERMEIDVYADTDLGLDINFQFTPTKNIARIDLYVDSNLWEYIRTSYGSDQIIITSYFGEFKGDNKYNFNIEFQSEEAGLLSGLIGWVQNIFAKIGDTFDKVTEIFTEIKNLPAKIWTFISDGLQNLFIPDAADIENFKNSMGTLLEDKLGAVYQVSNTVIETWERIQSSDEQDTIHLPEVSMGLPEGNTFTYGGYDVKIVPDGFAFVAAAVKTITGVLCTVAVINGLRKRYDEVMGG